MGQLFESKRYKLYHGDCFDIMPTFEANSFDTLITDCPSGINFMGKIWDNHSKYIPHTPKGQSTLDALTLLQLEPWAAGFVAFTVDWASLALALLKPGAMGLVWALPRTSDLTGLGLRLAGFEVRDNLYHLFGSGFPKSHDISAAIDKAAGADREVIGQGTHGKGSCGQRMGKEQGYRPYTAGLPSENNNGLHDITAPATDAARLWQGWGTALKPAVEEWILVQKSLEGTYAQNALAHGVAGLWVDGCRVDAPEGSVTYQSTKVVGAGRERASNLVDRGDGKTPDGRDLAAALERQQRYADNRYSTTVTGRWPANLLLDQQAAALLDEQSGELGKSSNPKGSVSFSKGKNTTGNEGWQREAHANYKPTEFEGYGNTGGASKYFTVLPDEVRFLYTAKSSTAERNEGLDHIDPHQRDASRNADQPSMNGGAGNPYNRGAAPVKNFHPTVKPIELMRWLVRLTKTPTGGDVLDPFVGSGTTIVACLLEGRHCTGIDSNAEYIPIAHYRAEHWQDEASVNPRHIKGKDNDFADMPLFQTGG